MSSSKKVVTSIRVGENWMHNIKLKYGSVTSWVAKSYIKEFGDDELSKTLEQTITDCIASGSVTKAQLKEIIKNA